MTDRGVNDERRTRIHEAYHLAAAAREIVKRAHAVAEEAGELEDMLDSLDVAERNIGYACDIATADLLGRE